MKTGRGNCKVCLHDERGRVELLLARKVPLRIIQAKFDLHPSNLCRHRKNHMPPGLKAALLADVPRTEVDLEQLRQDESEKLLQNLVSHRGRIWALLNQAEDDGDFRAAATLHSKIVDIWKLEAEFLGELNSAAKYVTNNVLIAPVYMELRSGLIDALRPFPEAARAVAGVLHGIEARAIEDGSLR